MSSLKTTMTLVLERKSFVFYVHNLHFCGRTTKKLQDLRKILFQLGAEFAIICNSSFLFAF